MTKIRYLSLLLLLWATGLGTALGQNTADYDPADPAEPTRPVFPDPEPQDTTTYYTLTLLASEGGSVKSGAGQYAAGRTVTVTANAAATNFRFLGWTDARGDTLSTQLSFSYTMPAAAATLTACYAFVPAEPGEPARPDITELQPEPQDTTTYYTLTLLATEGGSIKSGAGRYAAGTAATPTANAASANFRFLGWTDEAGQTVSTALSFTHTVTRDATLTARYEFVPAEPGEPARPDIAEPDTVPAVRNWTLTLLCPEGGTVTAGGQTASSEQTYQLAAGATLSLSVKLATNFTFAGWYKDGTLLGTSLSLTFQMDTTDVTLEPRYTYEPGTPGEPNASLTSRNELYMMSTVGLPGETINYPLYMNAVDTIRDISFQMQVPVGMTVDFEAAAISQAARGYTLTWQLLEAGGNAGPRRAEGEGEGDSIATTEVSYNTYAVSLTGGTTPPGSTALLTLPITIEEDIEESRYRVWLSQVTVQQNDSTVVSASSRNGAINTAFEEPTSYIYLENLINVGTGQVEISQSAQYSRAKSSSVTLDMAEVVQLLGCSDLSFVTFKGLQGEGTLTSVYTTSQGYWFGRDGYARQADDEDRAVQVDFDADTRRITLMQRPGFYNSEETDTLQLYFTYKYKYYGYQAILHIESGPDIIGDSLVFGRDYTLTDDSPLEGSVGMHIGSGTVLVIEADGVSSSGVTIRNLSIEADFSEGSYAQVLSTANPARISIEGDVSERIYTKGGTWYFICLPFDCDLRRTVNEQRSQYAIRYYDGASRAEQNKRGVGWKDFRRSVDRPLAGRGFIFQTEYDSWTRFYAVRNDSRLNIFASTADTKQLPLEANLGRNKANQGWNLMGNPFLSYFSGSSIGFDGPVTVWQDSTYQAYTADDEWVLRPNQSAFVQCAPDGVQQMGFPGSGRQYAAEWMDMGARMRDKADTGRRLINLSLKNERMADRTRLVINEAATLDYDFRCDAGKFMSLRDDAQQLYTIGPDGTYYAINERPLADGTVRLGITIPQDGEYTLAVTRNDAATLLLTDSETGLTTDLAANGSYTFLANRGDQSSRFLLTVGTEATGIDSVRRAEDEGAHGTEYYDLGGRRLLKPLNRGVYLQKRGQSVKKILVN